MDLLGISRDGIAELQAEIKNYKTNIENPLNELAGKLDYAQAFKGSTIVDNMKDYVQAVINELNKMLDFIEVFERSLDQVALNYADQSASVASAIGSDTSNVTGVDVQTQTGVMGFNEGGGTSSTPSGGFSGPSASTLGAAGAHSAVSSAVSSQNATPTPVTPEGNENVTPVLTQENVPLTDTATGSATAGATVTGGNYTSNGINTERIANTEWNAANENFIAQDKIYTPSFESEGVTFQTTGTDGVTRIDNEGVPIGYTDSIQWPKDQKN